jgi:hypothetical protein
MTMRHVSSTIAHFRQSFVVLILTFLHQGFKGYNNACLKIKFLLQKFQLNQNNWERSPTHLSKIILRM